jgi:hypothetical protein
MLNVMKMSHFGLHQEVNSCIKLLLLCYPDRYIWLDRRIIVDTTLIHQIIGLSVKGPDPQQFYLGKDLDHSLSQRIKESYREVEKGKRSYKIASIQDGIVRLSCQLLYGNLVRKNYPTQVIGFVVDLVGKCVEGMQMNWANYLINKLEKDFHEAQYLGYEFHYSCFIILISFVSWKIYEGTTFLEIEPTNPLAA